MNIEDMRDNIDKIDNAMKALFQKRMGYSKEIAGIKAENKDAVFKPEREQEMISRLLCGVDADIAAEYEAFLKAVVRISRQYQYKRLAESGSADAYGGISEDAPASIMVQTKDIAGLMSVISDYGFKVLKVASSRGNKPDNVFYIEIAAGSGKGDMRALMWQLSCETDKCVII